MEGRYFFHLKNIYICNLFLFSQFLFYFHILLSAKWWIRAKIRAFFDLEKQWPEEAAIVDDASAVGSTAAADERLSIGEASQAVLSGHVVSALHHGVHRVSTPRSLCCVEELVIVQLRFEVRERGVEVGVEVW